MNPNETQYTSSFFINGYVSAYPIVNGKVYSEETMKAGQQIEIEQVDILIDCALDLKTYIQIGCLGGLKSYLPFVNFDIVHEGQEDNHYRLFVQRIFDRSITFYPNMRFSVAVEQEKGTGTIILSGKESFIK